jgi:hypothetical protein
MDVTATTTQFITTKDYMADCHDSIHNKDFGLGK